MKEIYNSKDLGVLIDETNQGIAVYPLAQKIPMRSEGWAKFSIDVTLTASVLRIKARASQDTATYTNASKALLDVDEITESGYYEISIPTQAYDLELEWETSLGVNRTLVAMNITRP